MNFSEDNILDFESKSDLIKTMGHPIRLAIIGLLEQEKELTVTEIFSHLKIEQAVASHHLRLMKNTQIVASSKKGKNVYYSLAHENIRMIFKLLMDM